MGGGERQNKGHDTLWGKEDRGTAALLKCLGRALARVPGWLVLG